LVRGADKGTALGGIGHGVKASTEGVEEISEGEREGLGVVGKGLELIADGETPLLGLITGGDTLGAVGVKGDVGNCAVHGGGTTWGAGIGVGPDVMSSGNGRRERVVSRVGGCEDRPEDKENNSW
jgi:hypothetical protein